MEGVVPEVWKTIGSYCLAGIIIAGILWKVLDHVFAELAEKVSKDVYDEHCKRIDDALERGTQQFGQTQTALEKLTDGIAAVGKEVASLKAILRHHRKDRRSVEEDGL